MLKTRIQVYAAVALIVFLQTYFARSSFFYSDDFRVIEYYGDRSKNIFEIHNGHFAPLANGIYYLLFKLFGLVSYTPYLVFAGLVNLYFGISIAEYFIRKNLLRTKPLLLSALFLVVPYASHSIFWVASAINLLVPSLLLNLLCINYSNSKKDRREQVTFTAMSISCIVVGVGLGGYGLILIPSVYALNVARKNFVGLGIISCLLIPVIIIYSKFNSTSFSIFNSNFPKWVLTSIYDFSATIIPFLPQYNLFGQIVISLILISLGYSIVRVFHDFKNTRHIFLDLSITSTLTMFLSTIFLMYRARGGVENFSASRYVVLFNFMLFFISIAVLQNVLSNKESSLVLKEYVNKALIVILIVIVTTRVPVWHQSSLDASFQGQINKNLVIEGLCESELETAEIEKIALSDGLARFPSSMKSDLWDEFKRQMCV